MTQVLPKIAFSKWLDREELTQVKDLRIKCYEMNSYVSPLPDGKLPHVVRSGRLMERSSDRKLSFVQPRIDQVMNKSNKKLSSPDMGPKNERVRSQVVSNSRQQ